MNWCEIKVFCLQALDSRLIIRHESWLVYSTLAGRALFHDPNNSSIGNKIKRISPLGGDSEPGSESDDETRLRELAAVTLLGGIGKI